MASRRCMRARFSAMIACHLGALRRITISTFQSRYAEFPGVVRGCFNEIRESQADSRSCRFHPGKFGLDRICWESDKSRRVGLVPAYNQFELPETPVSN